MLKQKEVLDKIESWIKQNIPDLLTDLNDGASNDDILDLERRLDVSMPVSFKTLYLQHNGQKGDVHSGLFYGMTFLSIENIFAQWSSWDGYYKDIQMVTKESKYCKSIPENRIKKMIANPKWIPIAYDHGGNYFGIDLDPDESGNLGQVINFGKDESTKYVIASDLTLFLAWYAQELEGGNFSIEVHEGEGVEFNTLRPPTSHFLDSCKVLFKT